MYSRLILSERNIPGSGNFKMGDIRHLNPLLFILYLGLAVLWIIAWAQIFKKAGYSRAMCILLVIPLINAIVFLWFAFSRWPVQDRLREEGPKNSLPFKWGYGNPCAGNQLFDRYPPVYPLNLP